MCDDPTQIAVVDQSLGNQASIETKPSFSWDPEAACVIAGGLGGLGRAISRCLVGHGARTLILLSRSAGPKTPEAQDFVSKLRNRGVNIVLKACDISNDSAVAAALLAPPDMPIIKGCIQASMVLRDDPSEAMSFDTWQESLASKATRTWNLHEALPRGMDFFIMLSSAASTCGTRGQANYAAGNAFQNAVAHYRVAAGGRASHGPGPRAIYFSTLASRPMTIPRGGRFDGASGVCVLCWRWSGRPPRRLRTLLRQQAHGGRGGQRRERRAGKQACRDYVDVARDEIDMAAPIHSFGGGFSRGRRDPELDEQ